MINRKIELTKNYHIMYLEDFDSTTYRSIHEIAEVTNIKMLVKITNLDKLNQFKDSDILSLKNIHISIECTRNIYLLLDLKEVIERSIFKSIVLKEKIIKIDLFLTESMSDGIIQNNIKILDRINYMTDDIKIHSKNFEILYQAKVLLNELKKCSK